MTEPVAIPLWRRLLTFPAKVGWRDHVVAFVLAAPYVAWLLATARSLANQCATLARRRINGAGRFATPRGTTCAGR